MAVPNRPLTPGELTAITRETLAHYDDDAEQYWRGTLDHDVSQNISALLNRIGVDPNRWRYSKNLRY